MAVVIKTFDIELSGHGVSSKAVRAVAGVIARGHCWRFSESAGNVAFCKNV